MTTSRNEQLDQPFLPKAFETSDVNVEMAPVPLTTDLKLTVEDKVEQTPRVTHSRMGLFCRNLTANIPFKKIGLITLGAAEFITPFVGMWATQCESELIVAPDMRHCDSSAGKVFAGWAGVNLFILVCGLCIYTLIRENQRVEPAPRSP